MDSGTHVAPRHLLAATGLCFLAPLFLYALTAARTIQGGDAGELAVVAALGGVAHPPGYPIYVLLARLASHFPLGPIYWRIAMTSAVSGAAAVAVLFRVCFRLTSNLAASVIGAFAFAFSALAWRLAGVPEVFSLHALACATAILCCLRLAEADATHVVRESAVLGLVLGLGMANHQTLLLLAPVVLWAVLSITRHRRAVVFGKAAAAFVLCATIGLCPYLLLLDDARSASPHAMLWGQTDSIGGLLRHVLRRDYGTFQLASGASTGKHDPTRYVLHFLSSLPGNYAWVFFAAGLIGVAAGLKKARGIAVSFLASLGLCLLFLSIFNLTDTPTHREVVERFHLMPTLLFAPFVGWGLAELTERGLSPALLTGASLVLLAAVAFVAWPSLNWTRDTTIERMSIAEVDSAETDGIILGRGDTEGAAILWVTQVLHRRPDVRYVDVNLLTYPWYFRRIQAELAPIPVPPPPPARMLGQFASALMLHAPTLVIPTLAVDVGTDVRLEPNGFLDRVVSVDTPPLPLDEAESRLRRSTQALGPEPTPVDAWSEELHIAAAYKWLALADSFQKEGQSKRATACSIDAQALEPPGWRDR